MTQRIEPDPKHIYDHAVYGRPDVCPYCGMSTLYSRTCGAWCCNCNSYIDKDTVIP